MNVFVIGTGRCGTLTFSKASKFFEGFTAAHESKTKNNNLVYMDNHIESDPHLFWHLPNLIRQYPKAIYVHLVREKTACVKSLSKRPSLYNYAAISEMTSKAQTDLKKIASKYYDFINGFIENFFVGRKEIYIKMSLPPTEKEWASLHKALGKPKGFKRSFAVWNKKYNAS